MHYHVQKGVDLSFDVLGLFFEYPIQLWNLGMKYVSASVIAKLPMLWKVCGISDHFLFPESIGLRLSECGKSSDTLM